MVKDEVSPSETAILALLAGKSSGLSNQELMDQTTDMDAKTRGEAVNSLLSAGKIEMLQGKTTGAFTLRVRKGTQLQGASNEEQLIYSLIEESGKKGIWIRDIRDRTGLSQTRMRKVLNTLEQRKLVKSIKVSFKFP
ncbi:unnamed protein product [Gongylonema pulchrum]|uniref:TrmB domain-containing protein n=1 Tax=Gongylonema pulchrum TaxID=637853 RepID=A0A183EI57_9BILA|nr:unnamed protein product [Gongylonema pulchrum]